MGYITLDLFDHFTCMAGKCPSTCCAGWRIRVDREAYERFENLETEWLRNDILEGITKEKDQLFFKNQKDGSCIMLDSDHLCRIQRNTDEKTLCNTCRKYPRLTNRIEDVLYLSMAASCPVVAHYLVNSQTGWKRVFENGQPEILSIEDVDRLREVYEDFETNDETARTMNVQQNNDLLRFQCMEKMSIQLLDVITRHREGMYFLDYLEIFEAELDESECRASFVSFRLHTEDVWQKVYRNYLHYRMFSYWIEYPACAKEDVLVQTLGELLLLRMLAYCQYIKCGDIQEAEWEEMICKIYRFCAHGQKTFREMHNVFSDFFTHDFLWNYMLL